MSRLLQRFRDAGRGIAGFFATETNGQIQAVVALLVLAAGWWLGLSPTEWMAVLGCIALVLGLEMVNSALEKLCDHLHPERHPAIGRVKDMAAGAVLWAAVISAIIGLVVFLPKIAVLLGLAD